MLNKAQQMYLEVLSLVVSIIVVLCFGLVMKDFYQEAAQFIQVGKFIHTNQYELNCNTSTITYEYQVNKQRYKNNSVIPRHLSNLCKDKNAKNQNIAVVYLPHNPKISNIQTINDFKLRIDLIELWLLFVLIGTFLGLIAIGKRIMDK